MRYCVFQCRLINQAKSSQVLAALAADVEAVLGKLGEVLMHMGKTAMSAEVMSAFAFAHPLLDAFGDVVMAWMLLWRASVAEKAMSSSQKDAVFYQGQITSAKYFIETILPVTHGKINSIMKTSNAPIEMDEAAFAS